MRKSRGRASDRLFPNGGSLILLLHLPEVRSSIFTARGVEKQASEQKQKKDGKSKSSAWRGRREEKRRIRVALAKRGKRLERNLFPTTRYISCTLGGPSIFTHGPNVNSNTRCQLIYDGVNENDCEAKFQSVFTSTPFISLNLSCIKF